MLYELLKNNKLIKSSDLEKIEKLDEAILKYQKRLETIKPLLKNQITWYQTSLTEIANNLTDSVKSKDYTKTSWYKGLVTQLNKVKNEWNELSNMTQLLLLREIMQHVENTVQTQLKNTPIPNAISFQPVTLSDNWLDNFSKSLDSQLQSTLNTFGTLFDIGKSTFTNILNSFQSTSSILSNFLDEVKTNTTLNNIVDTVKNYVSQPSYLYQVKDVSANLPSNLKNVVTSLQSAKVYAIDTTQNSKISLSLTGLNYDLDLAIYNAQGQLLKQNIKTGTKSESITNYKLAQGQYYVIIDGDVAIDKANYSLSMKGISTTGSLAYFKNTYKNYYDGASLNNPTIITNSTPSSTNTDTKTSVVVEQTESTSTVQLTDAKLSFTTYLEPLVGYIPKTWNDSIGKSATITYSFMKAIPSYYPQYAKERQSFQTVSDAQKATILKAMKAWENVANVKFVESNNADDADMQIGSASLDLGAAWAYYPGAEQGGDFWLDSSTNTNTSELSEGGYGYLTIMHEIGHALGLKHPGDYNNLGELGPFLSSSYDSRRYTIMSYNRDPYEYYRYSGQESSTPQILDVSAMQYLYGANTTYHNGNDIYRWETNSNPINTIWDTGGNDTIDASNQTRSSIIDLRANYFSSIGSVSYPTKIVDTLGNYVRTQTTYQDAEDNVAIADRVVIENAIGGDNNDVLIGNQADNQLQGGNGDDIYVIYTNSGNDTIVDAQGNDSIEIHAQKASELSGLQNVKLSLIDSTKIRLDLVLNDQSSAGSITTDKNIETLKLFDQNQKYLASINLNQQINQLGNATPAFGSSIDLSTLNNTINYNFIA